MAAVAETGQAVPPAAPLQQVNDEQQALLPFQVDNVATDNNGRLQRKLQRFLMYFILFVIPHFALCETSLPRYPLGRSPYLHRELATKQSCCKG